MRKRDREKERKEREAEKERAHLRAQLIPEEEWSDAQKSAVDEFVLMSAALEKNQQQYAKTLEEELMTLNDAVVNLINGFDFGVLGGLGAYRTRHDRQCFWEEIFGVRLQKCPPKIRSGAGEMFQKCNTNP